MTGIQHLLTALGIKINPQEIEEAWDKAKDALPKLAANFEVLTNRLIENSERLKRIEQALNLPPLENKQNVPAVLDGSKTTAS